MLCFGNETIGKGSKELINDGANLFNERYYFSFFDDLSRLRKVLSSFANNGSQSEGPRDIKTRLLTI